jgi:hypothetical protein
MYMLKESQTKGEPDMETSVKELSIKEQQIMKKLCQTGCQTGCQKLKLIS